MLKRSMYSQKSMAGSYGVNDAATMITLQGKNLCERQKELNFKVKEAAEQKVNFKDVKFVQENSDVDRLFKIDLASKYRDTDYFIEVLKCGDSLYISRALKWEWIYDNAYSHIINPDNLHHSIFPAMSFEMKMKTLTTIAKHVRDEGRAQKFYEYCININMRNNAYKFLRFTSESFKQKCLPDFVNHESDTQNRKNVIGNSFFLAEFYSAHCRGRISDLSYLYSVNEVEYLNLFEKYTQIKNDNDYYFFSAYNVIRFGGKMSRSILKKHKIRILNNPLPYIKVLKQSELIKYISSDDVRKIAVALLPNEVDRFWRMDYYTTYKHILDLLKTESKYQFIKHIFTEKYFNEEFEMAKRFYELDYYDLMTVNERETWALVHLEKKTGVIPEEEDYRWYEFVNFPQAFEEIKKKIIITTNADKRSEMLVTLTKSAKTQNELKELLSYYYKRHVNERSHLKERFLKNVTEYHTVFELDSVCWDAFEKLLHSLDIYNSYSWLKKEFLDDSLVYYIINKITLPSGLNQHLNKSRHFRGIEERSNKLCADKRDLVYDYIFQFFTNKIQDFELLEYTKEVEEQVREFLESMINLKQSFKKDGDYPEIVLKFMKLNSGRFDYIVNPKPITKELDITEGFLIRCLKQEPTVILENFSLIEKKLNSSYDFRLNMVLKKLKIYFSNDLAKQYLDLCQTSLLNKSSKVYETHNLIFDRGAMFANIFAVFQLADEHTKSGFMDKHAPISSKIEYDNTDKYLEYIQEGICRLHCYSRPPVALAKTALYLKGDYLHLSKDIFDMYLMKLTPTRRSEFIRFLLDSPVSIQKRGLRLAFHAFETGELKDTLFNVWNKTKNVSVRSNLYKSIVEKIKNEKKTSQLELFQLLKALTACIHQEDDEGVFEYFTGNQIPEYLRGVYLETAWKTVLALPDNKANIQRRMNVVEAMKLHVALLDEAHVETLVYGHVHKRLLQEELRPVENPDIAPLNEALWDFVQEYIVNSDNELKQEKRLNVVKLVVQQCFNHWNETHNTEEFVYQLFFKVFANKLHSTSFSKTHLRVKQIIEYLLESFEKKFGLREMYSYYWDWKLSIITRKLINDREEIDKKVHICFGTELGKFVKALKERNCYYNSFFSKIMGKISYFIQHFSTCKPDSMTDNDSKILIAYGLSLQESLETSTLALHILPNDLSNISVASNELQDVITTIKKQNSEELNAFMNDKFIYSDCKVRKIMIL